jgi:poly(A)-specific ribonuclease
MEVTRGSKLTIYFNLNETHIILYITLYLIIDFREVILELERVLPAAQFLAIDGEFTGLHRGEDVNAFDTPSQYYSKLRSGSVDFLLVQFGLCAFSYNKENDK